MPRFSRSCSRFLVSASLLGLPALALVPGCGGGGGDGTTNTTLQRALGVELIDNSTPSAPFVFDRGNLTVGIVDSSSSQKSVSGTLQILGSSAITPTVTAPIPAGLPSAGTVNLRPLAGSYLFTGNTTYTGSANPFPLSVNGAFQDGIPFSLTGNFSSGQILVLRAQLKSGTVVIPMRVLNDLVPFVGTTPTATPVTTTGATATATGTATATASATATLVATTSPTPTATTGSPVGTPPSPVGTPPSLP